MQDIVVANLFFWVEVEPVLAAFIFGSTIPGDRQRLQSAIRKFDQILLQRIDAERILDLEDTKPSVRSVGLDEEFSLPTKEARVDAIVIEWLRLRNRPAPIDRSRDPWPCAAMSPTAAPPPDDSRRRFRC
jgi:hypothetical protein